MISRNDAFTQIVEEASTVVPAYAPPLRGEEPLDDEKYYWAVVPVNERGEVFDVPPEHDFPQTFRKVLYPSHPARPVNGVDVDNQPTFSWTPAEGALNYTLQVSRTPRSANRSMK